MALNYDQIYARALELQKQAQAKAAAEQQAAQQAKTAGVSATPVLDEMNRQAALAEQTRSRTGGEVLRDVGVDTLQTAMGLGQALYGAANLATLGLLDRGLGLSDNFREARQIAEGWHSAPLQRDQARVDQAFDDSVLGGVTELVTSPSVLLSKINESAGYLLPGVAAARGAATLGAARGLTGGALSDAATSAAIRAGAGTAAGATNVDAVNSIEQAGGSETLQQLGGLGAGLATGLGTAAISRLTGGALAEGALGRVLAGEGVGEAFGAGARSALAAGAIGTGQAALRGGVEEAAQSSLETVATNVPTPGANWDDNVGKAAGMGGVLGAVMEGPIGGYAGAAQARSGAGVTRKPSEVRTEVDTLADQLGIELGRQQADEKQAAAERVMQEQAAATAAAALRMQEMAAFDAGYGQSVVQPEAPQPAPADTYQPLSAEEAMRQQAERQFRARQAARSAKAQVDRARYDETRARVGDMPQFTVDPFFTALGLPPQVDQLPVAAGQPQGYELGAAERVLEGQVLTAEQEAALREARARAATPKLSGGVPLLTADPAVIVPPPTNPAEVVATARAAGSPVIEVGPDGVAYPQGYDLFGAAAGAPRPGRLDAETPIVMGTDRPAPITPAQETASGDLFSADNLQRVDQQERAFREQVRGIAGTFGVDAKWLRGTDAKRAIDAMRGRTFADSLDAAKSMLAAAPESKAKWATTLRERVAQRETEMQAELQAAMAKAEAEAKRPRNRRADATALADAEIAELLGAKKLTNKAGVSVKQLLKAEPQLRALAQENPQAFIDRVAEHFAAQGLDTGKATGWVSEVFAKASPQPAEVAPAAPVATDREVRQAAMADAEAGLAAMRERHARLEQASAAAAKPTKPTKASAMADVDAAETLADLSRAVSAAVQGGNATRALSAAASLKAEEFATADVMAAGSTADLQGLYDQFVALRLFDELLDKQQADNLRIAMANRVREVGGPSVHVADAETQQVGRDKRAVAKALANAPTLESGLEQLRALQNPTAQQVRDIVRKLPIDKDQRAEAGSLLRQLGSDGARARDEVLDLLAPRLARGAQGAVQPMDRAAFDKAVELLRKDGDIVVYEDAAAYTADTGVAIPAIADALYDGRVVVLRNRIADLPSLVSAVLHERAHDGLTAMIGAPRTRAAMNRMWANAALRKDIQRKMKAYGITDRAEAAEEVLVDMRLSGKRLNGDVLSKLRGGLDNVFMRLVGAGQHVVTNQDVDTLLDHMAAYRRGMPTPDLGGWARDLPAETVADGAVAVNPRFSRALDAMDETLRTQRGENPKSLASVYKSAADWGKSLLTDAKGFSTVGRGFGSALAFMPLDQIRNTYDHMFTYVDGDGVPQRPLNTYTSRVIDKAGEVALGLNRERPMYYVSKDAAGNRVVETFAKLSPTKVSHRWNELRNDAQTAPAVRTMEAMRNAATLFRIFPDRAVQEPIDYAAERITPEERADAEQRIKAAWNALPPSVQELYRMEQAVSSALFAEQHRATIRMVEDVTGVPYYINEQGGDLFSRDVSDLLAPSLIRNPNFNAEMRKTLDAALTRSTSGPYASLVRHGDYVVTVRKRAQPMADGSDPGKPVAVEWFSGHDSLSEQQDMVSQLRLDPVLGDATQYEIVASKKLEFDYNIDGIDKDAIAAIDSSVAGMVNLDEQARHTLSGALKTAYLQSLPDRSYLQHARQRKGIDGASLDGLRSFSDYAAKLSRAIANLKYDHQIGQAMTAIDGFVRDARKLTGNDAVDLNKLAAVANAVKAQRAAYLGANTNAVVDTITEAGFIYMMTSPAQLLLNASQTFLVSTPVMAAKYGAARTAAVMRDTLAKFARSGGDLLGETSVLPADDVKHAALTQLRDRGRLDLSLHHDMLGLAEGKGSAMHGRWRSVREFLGQFMSKSETFNRQVTALTAMELEQQRLQTAANNGDTRASTLLADRNLLIQHLFGTADRTNSETHGTYDAANRPPPLQGNWGKLFGQFQMYRLTMLSTYGRYIRDALGKGQVTKAEAKEARRVLAYLIGTQLATVGATGTVLAPLVFAAMNAFKDDDDLLDARTEFIQSVPSFMAFGAIGQLVDPTRFSASGLIPFLGDNYAPKDATAAETFRYHVTQMAGPWAGMTENLLKGLGAAADGDIGGATKLLPALFRDVGVAAYNESMGVRDAKGTLYHDPGAFTTLAQSIGLRSAERFETENTRNAVTTASMHASAVRKRYLDRLTYGRAMGDAEIVREAMADIHAWRQSHPTLAITAQDIARAGRTAVQSQALANQFGVPLYAPPPAAIRQAVGI